MEHAQNFDKQNYDESIIDYIGERLRERKISRDNFDELILTIIHQICQTFPPSTIALAS